MASLALRALTTRGPLEDAKETLSSWDKCMDKNYCKWPVIVAIILGSIIVLSIVLCIARCLCCGAQCVCCCFTCCAGCCGGGSKSKKQKYLENDPLPPSNGYGGYGGGGGGGGGMPPAQQGYAAPTPVIFSSQETGRTYESRPLNQQYRSHAPPTFNPVGPVANEPAQYARFESSKPAPVNEDALPAMPTWSEATSTHIPEETYPSKRPGDMEMHRLDTTGAAIAGAGASRRSPGIRSPASNHALQQRSPAPTDAYGFPNGYQHAPTSERRISGYNGQYAVPQEGGYRGMSPVHALSPAQSMSPIYTGPGAGYAQYDQHRQQSPAPAYSPPGATGYSYSSPDHNQHANPPYQNLAYDRPAPTPSPSIGYAPSGSTRYEHTHPGTSTSPAPAYPGQTTYQAFQPVERKPVEGSWREV